MANQVNTLTNQGVMLDLYKIHAYIPNDAEGNPLTPFGNFSAGYEAASQHYEREIAELNKQYLTLQDSTTLIANKYLELSAQVNKLREALEKINEGLLVRESTDVYNLNIINEALSITAPQSLQAFENEVLERAAEAIDEMVVVYTNNCDRYKALGDEESTERNVNKGRAAISCAEAIRALKGQDSTQAASQCPPPTPGSKPSDS